jgi:hypothetical protein
MLACSSYSKNGNNKSITADSGNFRGVQFSRHCWISYMYMYRICEKETREISATVQCVIDMIVCIRES